MGNVEGTGITQAQISAKVRRADGTVEELGVIAEYQEPKYKTLLRRVYKWLMS